jgi:uncharacterized protein (TIGR02284 family)
MGHKYTIETLLEVIAERRDCEEGFRLCAGYLRSGRLSATLGILARECEQAASELEDVVRALGADPGLRPCGSSGVLRSVRLRPWSALACGEDGAILEECEQGASRLLEVYRNALDEHLPEWVRSTVLRQFKGLMASDDQIRNERPIREIIATSPRGAQAGQSHPD